MHMLVNLSVLGLPNPIELHRNQAIKKSEGEGRNAQAGAQEL